MKAAPRGGAASSTILIIFRSDGRLLAFSENKMNIVILAAGMGKRMHSRLPKVLQPIAGRPMIDHVLDASEGLSASPRVVVVGHAAENVMEHLADRSDRCFPGGLWRRSPAKQKRLIWCFSRSSLIIRPAMDEYSETQRDSCVRSLRKRMLRLRSDVFAK